MTLYAMITKDKYELPLAISESVVGLARLVDVRPQTISRAIWAYKRGYAKSTRYIKIDVEDD